MSGETTMLPNEHSFDFTALREQGITRIGELNPYVTLACDLRCDYCYMFDFLAKAKDETELMPPGFLLGLVDYCCEQNGQTGQGEGLDRMTFLGGEPTLHPDITQMANEAADRPIGELRMTTNGVGLHYLDLDKLRPNVFDHVSISIDGTEAGVNDMTRGRGTFNRILGTMGLYREAGVPLSINYTVTNNNINTLGSIASFFASQGVSILNLHRASLTGNAYNNTGLIVSPADWVTARDTLLADVKANAQNYAGLKLRVPYIFLTPEQIQELGYQPIQENNYHSPDGGHRLIVFPTTTKGRGLCYMSSDLIGEPNGELGHLTKEGVFVWNDYPSNELTAYRNAASPNIATTITGQTQDMDPARRLVRVSHSFKRVIQC